MISGAIVRARSPESILIFLAILALIGWPEKAASQTIGTQQEIARVLVLENVAVENGTVSGLVRNKSPHTVRQVELFIRYTWLWDDERHPGKTDPGTSDIYTLQKEISPGGTAPFTFTPSPQLPKIMGGRFTTSVTVAGFTEVIPQTK